MSNVRLLRLASGCWDTSAISASTPPSPLLSARITKIRYLMEMSSVSAQKISDSTPITLSGVGAIAWMP